MRAVLGALAIVTIGFVSYQTLHYAMGALDGLMGMLVAVVLGVEALEAPATRRSSLITSLGKA